MSDVQPATASDAIYLAALHAQAFNAPWSAGELADLLAMPGAFALHVPEAGFILCRVAADEAEVLTLAVVPELRRQGLAGRLLQGAIDVSVQAGGTSLFLEVDEHNTAARALYARAGFVPVGRRPGYYDLPSGRVDALILRRGA